MKVRPDTLATSFIEIFVFCRKFDKKSKKLTIREVVFYQI